MIPRVMQALRMLAIMESNVIRKMLFRPTGMNMKHRIAIAHMSDQFSVHEH